MNAHDDLGTSSADNIDPDDKGEKATTSKQQELAAQIGPDVRKTLIRPLGVFLCVLAIALVYLPFLPSRIDQDLYGCDDRGNVWLRGLHTNETHNKWNPIHALDINLVVGDLTFVQAKIIDICWDLLLGRGLQALGAVTAYYCFRGLMADIMLEEPLTHAQVLAIQYSTTSPESLWPYVSGCWYNWRSRSARYLSFLTLSVLYILSLPTWLSAMTAYQTLSEPMLSVDKDSSVPFHTALRPCSVGIVDAHRISPAVDHCVRPGTDLAEAVKRYTNSSSCKLCYPHGADHNVFKIITQGPTLDRGTPSFGERHQCNLSSIFEWPPGTMHQLPDPILNLTAWAYAYHDPSTNQSRTFYGHEVLDMGRCQLRKGYTWGFSFILLYGFVVTSFGFVSFWWVLMTRSRTRVPTEQVERMFGNLSTALVVAKSIHKEVGEDVESLCESGLRSKLRAAKAGIQLDRDAVHLSKAATPCEQPGNERSPMPRSLWIPMNSEAYKAYIRDGLRSLTSLQKMSSDQTNLV